MTFEQFLAEIKRSLRKYDESNLIDEISVYEWVCDGLKKFGANIMDLHTTTIEINNSKGSLPINFFQMKYAVRCSPAYIKCDSKEDEKILINSFVWRDIQKREKSWDVCTNECYKDIVDETLLEDNLYVDGRYFKSYYKKREPLVLAESFIRDSCTSDCQNTSRKISPYEIMIQGNTIYTNFKEGNIYFEYKGLQCDEDGKVFIPDTPKGELKKYLEYLVKRNIFEELIGNSEDTNIITLFNYYDSKVDVQLSNAVVETKFNSLSPKGIMKLRERGIRERMAFETGFRKWR